MTKTLEEVVATVNEGGEWKTVSLDVLVRKIWAAALRHGAEMLPDAPNVPYDPSVPQDVMSEMYRDMENVSKGWEACRQDSRAALLNEADDAEDSK